VEKPDLKGCFPGEPRSAGFPWFSASFLCSRTHLWICSTRYLMGQSSFPNQHVKNAEWNKEYMYGTWHCKYLAIKKKSGQKWLLS